MATLTDHLTSKVAPHNLEAERAVLGLLLIEPSALALARESLQPSDFYKDGHRRLFASMCAVADAGQGLDLITVGDALRREAALDEIGGPVYLAQLTDEATLLTELPSYCRIVAEKARARARSSASAPTWSAAPTRTASRAASSSLPGLACSRPSPAARPRRPSSPPCSAARCCSCR